MQPLDLIRFYSDTALTIPALLQKRVDRLGAKPMLRSGVGEMSYAEFGRATSQLANALARRGLRKGDRVAIVARNHPAHLLTLFSAAKIGAIMVPANPDFTAGELAHVLEHAGVSGVIVSPEVSGRVAKALEDREVAPFILEIAEPESSAVSLAAAMACESDHYAGETVGPDDPCLIIYTSGTSGTPKGVVHSQRNFILCGQANIQRLHLQPDDVVMIVLPFFHVNALFYSTAGAFCAGATIAIQPRFSASGFWEEAVRTDATTVNVIEAIGNILLARDRSEFRPQNRIRAIYGIRPRYEAEFRREFAIPQIVSGYGMTEIPGVTCGNLDAPNKIHSMGRVLTHPDPAIAWASCRIVDDHGQEVADGVAGELLVKSPVMMLGYHRDPESTAKSVRDGWFATGDIVRRDADGEYFFVSRKKDIIRRRGENISGAELDTVIGSHPGVFEAAVIAVPAELGEDEILAVVVVKPGHKLEAADIATWCAERLAPMKVPRFVTFVEALPHTTTHKVAKAALRSDESLLRRAHQV